MAELFMAFLAGAMVGSVISFVFLSRFAGEIVGRAIKEYKDAH